MAVAPRVLCLFIIGAVALFGVVVYYAPRLQVNAKRKHEELFTNGVDLVENFFGEIFEIEWEGSYTSNPVRLEQGIYKIFYQFPADQLVKVDIVSTADGERETAILKSSSGEAMLTIQENGKYIIEVETPGKQTRWSLEFKPVQVKGDYL